MESDRNSCMNMYVYICTYVLTLYSCMYCTYILGYGVYVSMGSIHGIYCIHMYVDTYVGSNVFCFILS